MFHCKRLRQSFNSLSSIELEYRLNAAILLMRKNFVGSLAIIGLESVCYQLVDGPRALGDAIGQLAHVMPRGTPAGPIRHVFVIGIRWREPKARA